jgi:hippurate hydrolase
MGRPQAYHSFVPARDPQSSASSCACADPAQAESFGAEADVDYQLGFPSLVNHAAETQLVAEVARETFGEAAIAKDFRPRTASEDFAFYLERRPGSFVFVGNGDGPTLHSASYNFNDKIIAPAATLWVRLAERFLS